jgi:hypothetical protein
VSSRYGRLTEALPLRPSPRESPRLVLQRHFVTVGVAVPDMGRPPPDHRGL